MIEKIGFILVFNIVAMIIILSLVVSIKLEVSILKGLILTAPFVGIILIISLITIEIIETVKNSTQD